MPWYQCPSPECGTAFEVGATLRRVHPTPGIPHRCIDCGTQAPFVIDTEEQWWLTMQQAFNLPRDLLAQLLDMWKSETRYGRFDQWLEEFQNS